MLKTLRIFLIFITTILIQNSGQIINNNNNNKNPVENLNLDWNETSFNLKDLDLFLNQTEIVCDSNDPNFDQTDDGIFCETISDGYLCWNKTKAGERAYQACPFNIKAFAFKDCLSNGTWFRHPLSNAYWTNYTPCFIDRHTAHTMTSIFAWGYLISIIALIISLLIFTCFRQLSCARVSIHKNLFMSYIINAIVWIIEYKAIVNDAKVLLDNSVWCQIVHILTQYSTCCNYFWMFCEGFFMHTVIVKTFNIGHSLRNICYIIGWGFPIVPSVIYTVLRSLNEDNVRCWTRNSSLQWIIQGPIVASLLMSLLLGANILRIMMSKLQNKSHNQQFGRGVRATLILIPLLGLHYFMMPFKPSRNQSMKRLYDVLSAILISFQGLLVAILFCFFNEEVLSVLHRKTYQLRMQLELLENRPSNVQSLVETTSFSTRRHSSCSLQETSKQNRFEVEYMITDNAC